MLVLDFTLCLWTLPAACRGVHQQFAWWPELRNHPAAGAEHAGCLRDARGGGAREVGWLPEQHAALRHSCLRYACRQAHKRMQSTHWSDSRCHSAAAQAIWLTCECHVQTQIAPRQQMAMMTCSAMAATTVRAMPSLLACLTRLRLQLKGIVVRQSVTVCCRRHQLTGREVRSGQGLLPEAHTGADMPAAVFKR